ncbi:helix-turn-helix transcriptional regulator [Neptuniibacter sp. QD37_11]|uniref:AraC family transcriptional regulator n=1 Tax=Neptuniibacter sp. QD37_11 TaxID=3398209 RepID=UPI0039F448FA
MKSLLKFIDHKSGQPSDCGDVLDIQLSSKDLNWKGVVLEKGTSPHFYPTEVSTPYFYFALALEEDLHWEAEMPEGMSHLVTVPGDVWINPPNTPFTHKIDDPCYFVILAIEQDTLLKHCPLHVAGKSIGFLKNYNVHDNVLKGMIELFLMEVENGGKNGKEYLVSLISMLSVHYLNNYSDFADSEQDRALNSKFCDRELEIVNQFIDKHLDRQITVDDLAEEVGCSKFYFLREFKKMVGETPYQHLLNRRLDRAKTMLLSGHANIMSLALDLGFNDQSHFTRAFKKRFGTTPGKYREV